MTPTQENQEFLLKLVSTLGVILLSALRIIYSGYRKRKFLKELLRRKSAKSIERQNEILKIAMKSYSTGPVPSLPDLVSNIEDNWIAPRSDEQLEDDKDDE